MAIVPANKTQNYPSYLEHVSPHLKNKDVRYSLYAAGSLVVAAAALRWGNAQVGITLAFAGCFAQGYEAVNLAREIVYTAMDKETKNNQISKITDRFFTLQLVWGIAMNGINLSLLYRESSLLFQRANFYSIIFHATNLAALGYSIPCAMNFVFQGDGLFSENEQDAEKIDPFPDQPIDMLQVSTLWLSLLIHGVFKPLSSKVTMIWNTNKSLLEMPTDEISFKKISEKLPQWISSFSNPKPDKLFPKAKIQNSSDDGEKTKYTINQLFFHTLNISLMAARLYYHPFPTAIFFGLGLVYPTTFQKEKTIRRSWEIVPDFISMPIVTKCRYLFEHLSTTEAALAWWNAPRACLNGLCLAEDFRFYGRRFCQ